MSKASFSNDLQPTKLKLCLEEIKSFIADFTEENPLSQISLISSHDSKSEPIFNFGTSLKQMIKSIKHFDKKGGQFSILNTLLLALDVLKNSPAFTKRQIIILVSAISTFDKGSIEEAIEELLKLNVNVSIISLSASVRIFEKIAEITKGIFDVVISENHLQKLLKKHSSFYILDNSDSHYYINVGFPNHFINYKPFICACHNKLQTHYYECPQCKCIVCDIPSNCPICGIILTNSFKLEMHYRKLVKPFILLNELDKSELRKIILSKKMSDDDNDEILEIHSKCEGCFSDIFFKIENYEESKLKEYSMCSICFNIFCLECDIFIHENFSKCPGCTIK